MGQAHHMDPMGGGGGGGSQQQPDSFGHGAGTHEGDALLGGQSADGLSSFGDEGLPHVWSSRILGMSAGEQMASSASSDDFNLSSSEPDSASTGSASSTDTFGLLSAS